MNNIEQVRESISDASYALTQVGEDTPHLTLLVMQERLKRLVDLEYRLLNQDQMVAGSVAASDIDGWIENTGEQPCGGSIVVEVRLANGIEGECVASAASWDLDIGFGTITHWRFPATA